MGVIIQAEPLRRLPQGQVLGLPPRCPVPAG